MKSYILTCGNCQLEMVFLEKPDALSCEKCEHKDFTETVGEISTDEVIVGALKRIAYLEASICELKRFARREGVSAADPKDSVPFVERRGNSTSH